MERQQRSYNLQGRNIFFALPAYDHKVTLKAAISLARFAQIAPQHGIEFAIGSICGCSVVSKARNMLADEFLQTQCTDLMFIDSDINYEPEDILRLLAWTTEEGVGITAGVPCARKPERTYIVTMEEKDDGSIDTDEMGLINTKRVATAFMMVRRQVFETLRDSHPEWQYLDEKTGKMIHAFFDFKVTPAGYLGEDFLFCDRVREAGYRILIDPTIKLGHMGVMEYQGDFGNEAIYSKLPPERKEVA